MPRGTARIRGHASLDGRHQKMGVGQRFRCVQRTIEFGMEISKDRPPLGCFGFGHDEGVDDLGAAHAFEQTFQMIVIT